MLAFPSLEMESLYGNNSLVVIVYLTYDHLVTGIIIETFYYFPMPIQVVPILFPRSEPLNILIMSCRS